MSGTTTGSDESFVGMIDRLRQQNLLPPDVALNSTFYFGLNSRVPFADAFDRANVWIGHHS